MAMLNTVAKAITRPMPRMISHKSHSTLDYLTAGVFLASAGFFWRRNKRAAMASLVSGTAVAALSALTEYPGGVNGVFGLEKHRNIELGLAATSWSRRVRIEQSRAQTRERSSWERRSGRKWAASK